MSNGLTFGKLLEKAQRGPAYWVARAIGSFTEDLFVLMETRGVTKAELARRIDKSPAYITKVLRGDSNFTIKSMVTLARALDADIEVRLKAVDSEQASFFGYSDDGAMSELIGTMNLNNITNITDKKNQGSFFPGEQQTYEETYEAPAQLPPQPMKLMALAA